MHMPLLTLACILLITQITAMEVPKESKNIAITEFPLLNCKEESAAIMTAIIAYSESKDALRKTCRRVRDIMQNRERILQHPLLRINEKALSKFFPYYGALGNADIVRNLITKGIENIDRSTCLNRDICYELILCAMIYKYDEILIVLAHQSNFIEKLITYPGLIDSLSIISARYNQMDIVNQMLSALEKKNRSSFTHFQKVLSHYKQKHQEGRPSTLALSLRPKYT